MQNTHEQVQEYYGETLGGSEDLKTDACCPIDAIPDFIKSLLGNIHQEITDKFYGCGSPIPPLLKGKTVLDLGCGTGRDCYIISQLVGESGKVIGVDMTNEQLSVARKHIGYHMDKFGYDKPNVEFIKSFIEDLSAIEDNSVDIVVSNCVINLSPEKEKVFAEINRVLTNGGELYFSDIFASRRIPAEIAQDKEIVGECLGGALYVEDFRRMLQKSSFADYRIVSQGKLNITDANIAEKVGMIDFYSATVRTFKCEFEDKCENYGHVAFYNGTVENAPHAFILDDHHEFKTGLPYPVCGNTAKMLSETRYQEHFKVIGDFTTHYGIFDCVEPTQANNEMACC